ncbi:MAG: tRNA 2-thiouridine(34) synthase MnmA [Candidatus Magasanikbacteria bacterium]|nr:tRNA 2-thiouridine(34) synthase MnmA [Candidatus Magasanikbacteria bacterium]
MKFNKKIKVLVALSGGVDSAVAAALLVKAGYNVTAAFMINYDDDGENVVARHAGPLQQTQSCYVPDYRDAVRVAAQLNIPILKLNFVKEYKRDVLDYMFAEYRQGRTPNPDVMCNKFIKFGSWLKKAEELGFDYLATGHYARRVLTPRPLHCDGEGARPPSFAKEGFGGGLVHLLEAKDKNKDQTYFLHQLNQKQLSKTLFPVGEYTKPEVRKLAKKFGLPVADKAESMGICFIGEVPMKEFLEKRIKHKPGKIIMSYGKGGVTPPLQRIVVGKHDGLAFYTIGQRHLGLASPHPRPLLCEGEGNRPLYVVAKNIRTNELVVGYEDDLLLFSKEAVVTGVNWICQKPQFPLKCQVRLRHRQILQECIVRCHSERGRRPTRNLVIVHFAKPERAVTPGQFAVFYNNGACLGGGVIK